MAASTISPASGFSTRLAFVFAAIGSAVGLGNVWKFPYTAGENGGAVFVAVYLLGLFFVAAPIFVAEVLIGRRGAASPPTALRNQAVEHGRSARWRFAGYGGIVSNILVMSFYSVIAGWTLDYLFFGLGGGFAGLSADAASAYFADLQASIPRLIAWQGAFILIAAFIVMGGVRSGIERAVSVMTPALGVLLLLLVVYALIEGDAVAAFDYLFSPDFTKLTPSTALAALGQAFFTLSVGIGGVMMYGAYLPKGTSILRASFLVIGADTAVALLAGLAVFPIVFANGIDPSGGPGLVFISIPLAFSAMPAGGVLGTLFFFFLFIAALTSAISLFEPVTAHMTERGIGRKRGALIAAVASWLIGLLSLFSFNIWSGISPLSFIPGLDGLSFFALISGAIDKLILPMGGIFVAYFAGRVLSRPAVLAELGVDDQVLIRLWLILIRWVSPLVVAILFIANLV